MVVPFVLSHGDDAQHKAELTVQAKSQKGRRFTLLLHRHVDDHFMTDGYLMLFDLPLLVKLLADISGFL